VLLANHPLLGKTIAGDKTSRLTIRAAEDVARFSLRIAPASAQSAGAAFGTPLPTRIGGMVENGGRTALQLGPDEWVLLAPVAEAVLWPVASIVLLAPQLRAPNPDANRPL